MRNRNQAGGKPALWFFSPWVAVGALVFACLLCSLSAGGLYLTRSQSSLQSQVTAAFVIILAPTASPSPPGFDLQATQNAPTVPAPPPGIIASGAYVQIVGTGGTGLRLRSEPGLSGEVQLLGSEAEVFRVQDGPAEKDGYTWWFLVGPFDETRQGWAVSNYLEVVQAP
jgi:hypothetical protein